jgi:hypothetical protein
MYHEKIGKRPVRGFRSGMNGAEHVYINIMLFGDSHPCITFLKASSPFLSTL